MSPIKQKKVLINMPHAWVDRLDKIAENNCVTRSDIFKHMVYTFLDTCDGKVPPAAWVIRSVPAQTTGPVRLLHVATCDPEPGVV